jgi:hypothetical protein
VNETTIGSYRWRFNPLTIWTATRSAPPGLNIGTIWTTLILFISAFLVLRCFRSNQELTGRATFKIRYQNATLLMPTAKRGGIPTRLPPLGHAAALRH